MTSNFSGALKLVNLNDYIAPSQSCVVSLSAKKAEAPSQDGDVQLRQTVKVKGTGRFEQTTPRDADSAAPVRVTLHDCLACSGCITSAETVMLEQQSIDDFLSRLSGGDKAVIVSLSPQSRASLASHYNITPIQAFKKLTGFLKSLGVKAVFDTSASRDLSLIEACEEFVAKYKDSAKIPKNGSVRKGVAEEQFGLPVLASACPGWVCYAEKTHGSEILPFISSVKSPQQVMGAVIKRHACKKLGVRAEDVHHVTIMPCYDKKLEASRDDFLFAVEDRHSVTEVDSVLTSGEILDLLEQRSVDFASLDEVALDRMLTNLDEKDLLYGVRGGSGGYVDIIFRHAAKALFGQEISGQLEFKTLRNSDFKEITLEKDGNVVLRFACAYGFRNIQNLVRKIKIGKCEYDFVEIMACPSGCLNGGGQIKPKQGQSPKELIQALEGVYLQEVDVKDPFSNPVAKGLYDEWLEYPRSAKSLDVLHTVYHNREKNVLNQLSDW